MNMEQRSGRLEQQANKANQVQAADGLEPALLASGRAAEAVCLGRWVPPACLSIECRRSTASDVQNRF
jgi:hypothetical protein